MILNANGIEQNNRKKHERGPCLHCFRHVFAFKSFEQAERAGRHLDDAIPYLSIYLGHDSLDETSKYLKFSSELFPDAVETYGTYMEDLLPEIDYES
jgi:integrase